MTETRVNKDNLDSELKRIHREGKERVVSVRGDGPEVTVITEKVAPRQETR